MPECSDCTCMLVCVFPCAFAHETAGAACTRHSLLPPSSRDKVHASLGRIAPRKREHILNCHRPRRRTIQYSRDVNDRTDKPRRTGSPACAGDDSGMRRLPGKSREPASVFAAAGPGWDEPAFMGGGRRSGTGSRLPIVGGQQKRIRRAKTLRTPRFILHAGLIRRSESVGWAKER